jgi:sugar phosphate isomerase/epimerase
MIGCFLAAFHDRPLGDALDLLGSWGLNAAELAAGGFIPTAHCSVDELLGSKGARDALLDEFKSRDITITALNANGNPLHPDPAVGPAHGDDLRKAIELAGLLGVGRVIAMPGLPAGPGGGPMNWIVAPLDSGMLDVRDWQWENAMVPFWRDIAGRAEASEVRVCIEIHSHTLVFNGPTLRHLIDDVGSDSIGANLDPSHLWWQGIDPVETVRYLGASVYHAHAKDTRIDEDAAKLGGFFDDRWRRPRADEPQYSQGGPYLLDVPPDPPPWEFVAPGRGHGKAFWASFIGALRETGQDVPLSIELFDPELAPIDGVPFAIKTLRGAIELADSSPRTSANVASV